MALNEQEVLAYLQQHDDFLHTHAQVLGIRLNEAKVLSFNQGSLAALRQKTERMGAQLLQMLADAEGNRITAVKLQTFNQRLLSANTLGQLWQASSSSLRTDFALPHHALQLLIPPRNKARVPAAIQAASNGELRLAWKKLSAPRCDTRVPKPVRALFGSEPVLESFLQLPIQHKGALWAVLVIGHEDPGYFHADLQTDLVAAMANSLAAAMSRIMGLAA